MFEPGTLAKIVIQEGGKAVVGALIAVLAKPGEDVKQVAANVKIPAAGATGATAAPAPKTEPTKAEPAKAAGPERTPASNIPQVPAQEAPVAVPDQQNGNDPQAASGGKLRVSPLAAKIAQDMSVDLSGVRGSGPQGRIIKRDVLEVAARPARVPVRRLGPVRSTGPSTAGQAAPVYKVVKLEQRNIQLSNMRQTIARRLVQSKQTIPHFYVST